MVLFPFSKAGGRVPWRLKKQSGGRLGGVGGGEYGLSRGGSVLKQRGKSIYQSKKQKQIPLVNSEIKILSIFQLFKKGEYGKFGRFFFVSHPLNRGHLNNMGCFKRGAIGFQDKNKKGVH